MPCFPPPNSVTICEINRELVTAEALSEDRAKDSYGKILGLVFSPIPFQPEAFITSDQDSEQDFKTAVSGRSLTALWDIFSGSFRSSFSLSSENLLQQISKQGVSWHQHKHILAIISASNQVAIRDYEDLEYKEPYILSSSIQRDITAVEWRPNSGKTVAVACKMGICIWSASYAGDVCVMRPGIASYLGTHSKGSRVRWTMVDFLQSSEHVSSLSWSPDGRYLASSSCGSSAFMIWDVAQGTGTPIRRGLDSVSMLKWSPGSDYFFTAKFDGTFYLWETSTWTSERWSSCSGYVTNASWDPRGQMILLSFSESTTLGSIHFATNSPSLDAHLLSVDLPELASCTGSDCIEYMAWNASGERLAVSYKGGNDECVGLVAVYDVRRNPLVSVSVVGFIRGPGDKPTPLCFSFHDKFKQGTLLSVCWSSGWCCTYPLLFRSPVHLY